MKQREISRPELLAPGGSVEGIRACIAAGADAVYTGGRLFGARAYAKNAGEKELMEMIDLCHLHEKKLYLTVNTLLREDELEGMLYSYLEPLYAHGLDAVLVQDFGVYAFLREQFPELKLHASTQMSVSSVAGAALLHKLGFSRIVPARELTLEELARIHREVPVEIETFIHGALCYSYSGQCLMSSMIGGRSGNRGMCAQPCRQRYATDGKEACLLSLKDICTLELLPRILEAGVCSLKIEGRMKRTEYAAGVTAIYRRALDELLSRQQIDTARQELMDLYNRGGFSEGYYTGKKGPDMMAMDRPNHAGTPGAVVLAGGKLRALEDLHKGDLLEEEARGGSESVHLQIDRTVPSGTVFTLKGADVRKKGRILPRVRNEELLARIRENTDVRQCKVKIKGNLQICAGKPVILEAECVREGRKVKAFAQGPEAVMATGAGMLRRDYEKQLYKTGETPFTWEELVIEAQEGLFVPVSALNALRREVLAQLEKQIVGSYRRPAAVPQRNGKTSEEAVNLETESPEKTAQKPYVSAAAETGEQLEALLSCEEVDRIYADWAVWCAIGMDGRSVIERAAQLPGQEPVPGQVPPVQDRPQLWLMLPPVWREDIRSRFLKAFPQSKLALFDGIMLRSWQQLGEPFLKQWEGSLAADEFLYTWNRRSRKLFASLGIGTDTTPAELNRKELFERGCTGSEIPVYGREVMMTTAQCIRKNTSGCTKDEPVVMIRDRFGATFPVRCICSICSNRIYNSLPLDLSGKLDELGQLSPCGVRMRFTTENARETKRVVQHFVHCLSGKAPCAAMEGTTRGHYGRGVE